MFKMETVPDQFLDEEACRCIIEDLCNADLFAVGDDLRLDYVVKQGVVYSTL